MVNIQRVLLLVPIALIGVVLYFFTQQAPKFDTPVLPTATANPGVSVIATPAAQTVSPLTAPLRASVASSLPLTASSSSSPGTVTLAPPPTGGAPRHYTYEVVAVFPHDPTAFTQGLLFDEGTLYEGTGLYGESTLRKVDLTTGRVTQQIALPEQFFGEGIAIVGDQLFQLTWREGRGFIYNKATFAQEAEFTYPTEGWGLTYDGKQLLMSDGSAQIFGLDPATLTRQQTINVHDGQAPVVRLNELEYINGVIYANIWQTEQIAQIDPATGAVIGWIDLTGILPAADRNSSTDVLNGIAYEPVADRLFVTGKKWPKLFEIRLIAKE